MTRNRIHQWAVAASVSLTALTATVAHAEPVEVIFNNFLPPNFAAFKHAIKPWAAKASEASGGSMNITIPTSSMAPFPRLWDVVQDRVVDMGIVPLGINDKNISLPSLLNIPMVGNTSSALTGRALWLVHKEYFEAAGEYKNQGLVPLAVFVIGGNQFFSRETQIQTIDDFDGLKIRGEGRRPLEMMKRLGGSPVGAPGIKSFELLSNGVVDISMNPFGPAMNLGLVGHAPEITTLPGGFFRPGFAIVINQDAFDELDEAAQNALIETSGAKLAERIGAIMDEEDAKGIAVFKEAGSTITPASEDLILAVKEKTAFVEDGWIEIAKKRGIDGGAALSFFRQQAASAE